MFQIVKKLKLMKQKLRKLNSQHFKNIVSEASDDRKSLKVVNGRLQADPSNVQIQMEENIVYQKYRRSSYMAEMYLQQKSKATWIKLGDDNTKYFHSVIKHRRLQQGTTQLKDDQGAW
ncbi:hypothetical protein KY289_013459 [Solanum tuberosum]|nr:hypothetical protein KY289_013459 [Solanum tuberosum]